MTCNLICTNCKCYSDGFILYNKNLYDGSGYILIEKYNNEYSILLFKNSSTNLYEIPTALSTINTLTNIYFNIITSTSTVIFTILKLQQNNIQIALLNELYSNLKNINETFDIAQITLYSTENITNYADLSAQKTNITSLITELYASIKQNEQILSQPSILLITKTSNLHSYVYESISQDELYKHIANYISNTTTLELTNETTKIDYTTFVNELLLISNFNHIKQHILNSLKNNTDMASITAKQLITIATTRLAIYRILINIQLYNNIHVQSSINLLNIQPNDILNVYEEIIQKSVNKNIFDMIVSTNNSFTSIVIPYLLKYDLGKNTFPFIDIAQDAIMKYSNNSIMIEQNGFDTYVDYSEKQVFKYRVYYSNINFKFNNIDTVYAFNSNTINNTNGLARIYLKEFYKIFYRYQVDDFVVSDVNGVDVPLDILTKDIIFYFLQKNITTFKPIFGKLVATNDNTIKTFQF